MRIADYTEPTHPIRKDELNPLERHLWRFRVVCLETSCVMRGYRATPDVATTINPDLLFSLANHSLLLVCKFLEIWDSFGGLARDHARVVTIRRCVQPIVDRIRQWSGIDVLRDSALAHTYQTTDNKLISPRYILHSLDAPSSQAEIILLVDLVNFAVMAVLCAFEQEYLGVSQLFADLPAEIDHTKGIRTGHELDDALAAVLTVVDQKLAEAGISITGPIANELALAAGHPQPRRPV